MRNGVRKFATVPLITIPEIRIKVEIMAEVGKYAMVRQLWCVPFVVKGASLADRTEGRRWPV